MKKRTPLWILFGLLFFSAIFLVRMRGDMVDFQVNYRAAQRLRTGVDLYPPGDGHFMFKYLPFSALVYVPFSYLPLDAAKAAWYSLTVVCSIFLFFVSHRLVRRGDRRAAYLVVLPPLILAKFFFREMKLGQINTLVTSVMLLMVWNLRDREQLTPSREVVAGSLWGLATALKPYALIFLPYHLIQGRWRALLAGTAVVVLALLAPVAFYGWQGDLDLHRQWISTLSQSTPTLFASADNVSIIAFAVKWTGDMRVSTWIWGILVAALALLVLVILRRGRTLPHAAILECAVLLTLIPLVSPLGWDYTLLMSVLGVTLLVQNFGRFPKPWRWLLAVDFGVVSLTIYDVIGRSAYTTFMAWSVLTVSFLLIIGYLAWLRFKQAC